MEDSSLNSYDVCSQCGKPAKITFGDGKGGVVDYQCCDCFNRQMAEYYDVVMPENVPERLSFKGRGKKPHVFDIEFMIFGTGKSLAATEIGDTSRFVDVWGGLHDDFGEMMALLEKRIRKSLRVRYMDAKGRIKDNKAAGYIRFNRERDAYDVVIDGKPFSWEELEQSIASREGWKIKIEFGSNGVDFD
jgi:hypothetical protein